MAEPVVTIHLFPMGFYIFQCWYVFPIPHFEYYKVDVNAATVFPLIPNQWNIHDQHHHQVYWLGKGTSAAVLQRQYHWSCAPPSQWLFAYHCGKGSLRSLNSCQISDLSLSILDLDQDPKPKQYCLPDCILVYAGRLKYRRMYPVWKFRFNFLPLFLPFYKVIDPLAVHT